jgi:hypothetical protein
MQVLQQLKKSHAGQGVAYELAQGITLYSNGQCWNKVPCACGVMRHSRQPAEGQVLRWELTNQGVGLENLFLCKFSAWRQRASTR